MATSTPKILMERSVYIRHTLTAQYQPPGGQHARSSPLKSFHGASHSFTRVSIDVLQRLISKLIVLLMAFIRQA